MEIIFTIIGLLIHSIVFDSTKFQSEYILTITKENPYKVSVRVKFNSKIDTLSIHPACQNYDYPEGWSTFINPVSKNLSFVGDKKWIVSNRKEISYEVDLSFVQEKWKVGNEQAGIYMDNSMFVLTRALFVVPTESGKYKVTFNLPGGYSVITPWASVNDNSFIVDSKEELNNNTVVWGAVNCEKIDVKDFSLKFALLGYEPEVGDMVREAFKAILSEYLETFPETPKTNYLITIFPFEQNDGEAYRTSNAFTLKSTPSSKNKMIWANQFAHELFHFWNGRMINGPERSKRQWFSEGYTEYFANLALVHSGIITENEFYRLIEKTIGLYFYYRNHLYPEVSLLEAGSKKSKYRFGVYNGGLCAAFVMDMLIRAEYPDKTLRDFMNILFRKYGINNRPYTYEDLENEFAKFLSAKKNISFFKKYISGTEELPIEMFLNKMGINLDYTSYEGTAFLFDNEDANDTQIELRTRWLKD